MWIKGVSDGSCPQKGGVLWIKGVCDGRWLKELIKAFSQRNSPQKSLQQMSRRPFMCFAPLRSENFLSPERHYNETNVKQYKDGSFNAVERSFLECEGCKEQQKS